MMFQFFRRKPVSKRMKDRLESCVNTILDLNDRLGDGKIRPDIVEHFRRLKRSFANLDENKVDEKEIHKIEEATNKLLAEVRNLYGEGMVKKLYDMPKH